ncbi:MAG: hypothetical protein M1818_006687 [Claussenomyces sp. TS43310]|nr:MAG: hypothetical protein M1818_006687 [Claussenomyces sp. TS43310]
MGQSNCCTSRQSSSPDVYAPRPVTVAPIVRRQSFRYLRPVPDTSWSTASRFSKPEDEAELRAIFEDDMSNDEEFQDMNTPSRTLTAVGSRLRKHLSRSSDVSKRPSRPSVGNSEEEVARRKEMRYARALRTKEDLSNENIYDDDAKSISTMATSPAAPEVDFKSASPMCISCDQTPASQKQNWSVDTSHRPDHTIYSTVDLSYTIPSEFGEHPGLAFDHTTETFRGFVKQRKLDASIRVAETVEAVETEISANMKCCFKKGPYEFHGVNQAKPRNQHTLQLLETTRAVWKSYDGSSSLPSEASFPGLFRKREVASTESRSILESGIPARRKGCCDSDSGLPTENPGLDPCNQDLAIEYRGIDDGYCSETSSETASVMWSRAIRASRGERPQMLRSEKSLPVIHDLSKIQNDLVTFPDNASFAFPSHRQARSDSGERYKPHRSPDLRDFTIDSSQANASRHDLKSDKHLYTQAEKLTPQDVERLAESRLTSKELHRHRVITPPEAWARYPSHTRAERTESAGADDQVHTSDFAMKESHVEDTESQANEGEYPKDHQLQKKHNYNLPTKIRMKVRSSLNRIRSTRRTIRSATFHGRRSSTSIGGQLEYPELEILPLEGGVTPELEELELEVAAAMRREERITRMMTFHDGNLDIGTGDDTKLRDAGGTARTGTCNSRVRPNSVAPHRELAAKSSLRAIDTIATAVQNQSETANIKTWIEYGTEAGVAKNATQSEKCRPLRRSL